MLRLTVSTEEYLMIGDDIKIVFLGGSKNHTRVMLDIPKEINVVRSKVMEANATDPKKRDNLAHYYAVPELPEKSGYFHAQWRRQRITEKAKDYVILDNVRGKGQYVGTYMALTALERYWYGEGEVKFYLDGDEEYPTICGTGTEDYFGGAWSFATRKNGKTVENTFCTPYLGYPYYSRHDTEIHNDYHNDDMMPQRSFYRWHIPDPVLFDEDIRVTIQQIGVSHGGLFERQDDVATVAYWYQAEPHMPFGPLKERRERWPR